MILKTNLQCVLFLRPEHVAGYSNLKNGVLDPVATQKAAHSKIVEFDYLIKYAILYGGLWVMKSEELGPSNQMRILTKYKR